MVCIFAREASGFVKDHIFAAKMHCRRRLVWSSFATTLRRRCLHQQSSFSSAPHQPRILLVNPNTTTDFTDKIRLAGRAAGAAAGVTVDAVQPERGPKSIESVYEELLSSPPTLEVMRENEASYDAMVVACFSDHPALHAARECLRVPVVGLLDASVLTGLMLGDRVSIVSTSAAWGPLLRRGCSALLGCGCSSRIASIRTIDLPVLALEGTPLRQEQHQQEREWLRIPPEAPGVDEAIDRICAEAVQAVESDGAEVIVLGCAGMAGLRERVEHAVDSSSSSSSSSRDRDGNDGDGGFVAVVEPVAAAVECAASLARQRLFTAKRRLYAAPKD